ncbi:MAG: hypothetical protein WKG01_34450 [Kofleriaceae bacterium]
MLRSLVLASLVTGCAPRAVTLTPTHPANPDAPAGRLAGPPPALRPGVAAPVAAPVAPPATHDHHH